MISTSNSAIHHIVQQKDPHNHNLSIMELKFILNIIVKRTIIDTQMYHSVCLRLSCVVVVVIIIIGGMTHNVNNNILAIVVIMINALILRHPVSHQPFDRHHYEQGMQNRKNIAINVIRMYIL